MDADRVAHVGDSLHHDIVGANTAEMPSIFTTGGIDCKELGAPPEILPDEDLLHYKMYPLHLGFHIFSKT